MCQKKVLDEGFKKLICSSGGNAGLAVAYSGRQLGVPVIVVIPESTPRHMVEFIQEEGASVIVHGSVNTSSLYADNLP
jgi:L-serine/L-threonine ammonia-lyase